MRGREVERMRGSEVDRGWRGGRERSIREEGKERTTRV